MRQTMRTAVATASVLCVISGATAVLAPAGAAPRTDTASTTPSLPTLKIAVTGKNSSVTGPRTIRAGRVAIDLAVARSAGSNGGFESLESFAPGYNYHAYLHDFIYFYKHGGGAYRPTTKALRALRRVYANTHFYGGLAFAAGQTQRETVVLPKGVYYLDVEQPGSPTKLTVTGSVERRSAPHAQGTVTALPHHKFGGDRTLPHAGTITFANHDPRSIHVLEFRQIAAGTTTKMIDNRYAHLRNERSDHPASWFRSGNAVTNYIKPDGSQTLSYDLPKGRYLLLDFTYDAKTGNEYAYEGMHRTVRLT